MSNKKYTLSNKGLKSLVRDGHINAIPASCFGINPKTCTIIEAGILYYINNDVSTKWAITDMYMKPKSDANFLKNFK